jgi:hypothetical protein
VNNTFYGAESRYINYKFDLFTMNTKELEEHPLLPLLLNERLPTLGLDVETYGPYIVALFPVTAVRATTTLMNKDNENVNGDLLLDGWDDIQELLQASSEIQELNDDESKWIQLKNDLISTWRIYIKEQQEQQQLKLLEREQNLQKTLEQERLIAIENAATTEAANKLNDTVGTNGTSSDGAAKRALLNRFGYEDDDTTNDNTVEEGEGNTGATTKNSNKNIGKGKTIPPSTTTKREEQQKTKQHNQQKVDAKDERRKRATKGERHR